MEIKNEFVKKNLVALCAGFTILAALFPFLTVSTEGVNETITGIMAIDGGGLFAILMLICPVVLIVMNYIPQVEKYRSLVAIIAPIACIVSIVVCGIVMKGAASAGTAAIEGLGGENIDVKVSLGLGFILMIVGSIASFIAGAMTYHKGSFDSAVNKAKAKIGK